MLFSFDEGDLRTEQSLTDRFKKHVSCKPIDTINDEDFYEVLCQLRDYSSTLAYALKSAQWLVNLLMDDAFLQFYMKYLDLLCPTENVDYISNSINRCVTNFIKLQKVVWNVTNHSDILCVKLVSATIIKHLFRFLNLPQLHEAVSSRHQNALWLAHSAVCILQNIINHIPEAVKQLEQANGFHILSDFLIKFDANPNCEELEGLTAVYCDPEQMRRKIHAQGVKTSMHLLLAFLPNVDQNESDDLHIIYLLTALEDALDGSTTLYSIKFGYSVEELLVGFTALAKLDRNKIALLRNNAMALIQKALTIAYNMKYPYQPDGVEFVRTLSKEADDLAKRTLDLLWLLSFIPECFGSLKPGSDIRRLVDRFTKESTWPASCLKVAGCILWNLSFYTTLPTSANKDELTCLMTSEHRQCSNHGHLILSSSYKDKNVMLKVHDKLRDLGYDMWEAVDNETRFAGMAQRIQEASGMILGVSQAFIDSHDCRQQMRWAYKHQIPFYPLGLHKNVVENGWLAMLLTGIPCIPLYDDSMLDSAVHTLAQQLGDRGRLPSTGERPAFMRLTSKVSAFLASLGTENGHMEHFNPPSVSTGNVIELASTELKDPTLALLPPATPLGTRDQPSRGLHIHLSDLSREQRWSTNPYSSYVPSELRHILSWTNSDVTRWLDEIGLTAYRHSFSGADGSVLIELDRFRCNAQPTLVHRLLADEGMSWTDQQHLFTALTKLLTTNLQNSQAFV